MTKDKLKIGFARRGFSPSGGAEIYLQRLAEDAVNRGHIAQLFTTREWSQAAWPFGTLTHLRSDSPIAFAEELEHAYPKSDCDLLMSLDRVWRCDVYRAGDGVHRVWLEQRQQMMKPLAKLTTRINRKHTEILELETALLRDNGATWVIANSEMVKREIIRFYEYPAERINVIYNGVPLVDFATAGKTRLQYRASLGLNPDDLVLLFVGSGWQRKGLPFAIKALQLFRHPKCWLLVAGRGNPRRMQAENVQFLGVVRDLPSLYGAADIFVLPTLYDPFSNACLEALASGLPVITTGHNGFSELITDGVHGSVIDHPADVDAIVTAVRYWSDATRRAENRSRILDRAAQFDISRNVEQTLEILSQAANAVFASGKMRKT